MKWGWTGALLAWFATTTSCWPYDESLVGYNLNENKEAKSPVEYWGEWPDHKGKYFPSPENWRFPFYTLFLDRFVNGDPENDNINGTQFEHDISSNQMRHGGDVAGLVATLDYLQGMGIKGIYLAGTILMNQPWGADGYSTLDTTLLDQHFGNIDTWRNAITEIHKRGMYVIFDNTIATMGDLIGFEGYLNTTTPFSVKEHKALWKTDRRYVDFDIGNDYNSTCDYPRFWYEDGLPLPSEQADQLVGCYNSDFDQYGDIEAFGVFPDWQRQLAKFASVQDRLREWIPSVRERLIRHSCIIIASLDIDGFRYDKATQATVDALGEMSMAYRECARAVGKNNFFISGEITGGDYFGSIYLGRGRQQNQWLPDPSQGPKMTNESSAQYFLREAGHEALDSAAFHYSVYRTLTRFLGMDGNLAAGYDVPLDWVDMWRQMLRSNDLVNANTGKFDPRHMYGATNQDVFRWPTVQWGVERQLLGSYITTLLLPGIPLLLWGEEQAFYVLDATATNYIYGRQAMSPATAWRDHGCFSLNSSQYYKWPIQAGREGCHDDTVAYDHRDPSHPVRNILKHMYQLREQFPVLNDGYTLNNLSKSTFPVQYPGSNGTETETGMWSVSREANLEVQDFGSDDLNSPVWMVYQNDNHTVDYKFDCNSETDALVAPYPADTVVKNLFYPWDEFTLTAGPTKRTFGNATLPAGCYGNLTLKAFEFRAYVPKKLHRKPRPMITKFSPGHDVPIASTVAPDASENVPIELHFSEEMDCDGVTKSISLTSSTESLKIPSIDAGSVHCERITNFNTSWTAQIPSMWKWQATLTNVYNGIHQITVKEPKTSSGNASTNSTDHFLFRIGQVDNPMVFTRANYSTSLLHEYENGTLFIQHHAAGADKYRYSTNWGTTWSSWTKYHGGNDTIEELPWQGTKEQRWEGKHVRVEYWSGLTGSSDYYQEGDVGWPHQVPRRFPHIHFNGPFNQFGYDGGLPNKLKLDTTTGHWKYHFTYEWPAQAQINVWGMNPDGRPDQSWVLGDIDGDHVLDRMPPSSLSATMINITDLPPSPHLAWIISINDGTMRYTLEPTGDQSTQMAMYILFWIVPLLTGAVCVYVFMKSFYQVKFNQVGVSEKRTLIPLALRRKLKRARNGEGEAMNPLMRLANKSGFLQSATDLTAASGGSKRRMVLIATMEYDIEDWAIKIKIGGLGVMAQLMGKTLGHQDLIWVVPCVGGVDYPVDRPAEPMIVTILGKPYEVQVQYHILQNITYVLLDAPVFRQQSKSEPYPPRMDDLDSAIYYSAWNQCIAQTIKRFPIDLYHINDYHGSLAPLYLLPQTIPACLSLHNAEFQGLWPMRTEKEKEEVCSVFNLDKEITRRYVQFGEVFNLLHAGASYLRVHQQGFGAVGVSKKYGKRSYARYPIFWGLKKVGNLPNPDPSDVGEWNKEKALAKSEDPPVDQEFEAGRAELKRQAQEWAGLEQNPDADLLVFVGRWSMQKGVDLIADVMPAVLEARPNVQLICVGPVIDLYGKFAALKLDRMMKVYPGRVFSRPQFTALPPYIFSGAEFALIPSRDEPFGLVAVEFGRKGALGIGARVGGLGQMPGWWYNVESMTTAHLLHQFKLAIEGALNSKPEVRAKMRARSAKQRFPVAQWIEDLEILQSTSIRIHNKEASKSNNRPVTPTGPMTPRGLGTMSPTFPGSGTQTPVGTHSREASYVNLRQLSEIGPQQRDTIISYSNNNAGREMTEKPAPGLSRKLSLGVRSGPGHINRPGRRGQGQQDLALPDRRDGGDVSDIEEESDEDFIDQYYGDEEYTLTPEQAEEGRRLQNNPQSQSGRATPRELTRSSQFPSSPSVHSDMGLAPPTRPFLEPGNRLSSASVLSVDSVVGDKKDFKLQKVDPFFTDSHGEYARLFEKSLENLNAANSETQLCIEEFLVKSEKEWFDKFRDAKLGRLNSPAPSVFRGKDYVPPTGLRKWMQLRIGDWPVYSLLLGLGQIIAANSYQITLLTGEVGQTAEKLYGIATTYLITSILWWFVFRYFKSIVCLSVPWFFYGLAFLLIGLAHFDHNEFSRGWIQNVASGFYATASSSGSIFFALNFGDESGAPVKEWVFRACVIQGTQQAYVIALWYWGSTLTKASSQGLLTAETNIANTWKMTAICVPITVFLWCVGLLMFFGLPNYYRQSPGKVPSFYRSVFRRKIVIWNFAVVIIQNFFLSAPYGRNWNFLWSSAHAKTWQIVILCIVFFGFVWAGFLFVLSHLSKKHSWILPVFACGLGAPRWAQIWWGVSGIGYYMPWVAGGLTGGALASRSIWLWLGVLDAIQGLGFGMILLQTLTRMHMCFTLIVCQVLGSIATICARAFAPNNVGPGPISPDPTYGASAVANAWFWIALIFQLLICAGFLLFFRREQLAKP
ncbi:Cell wall alpha-1,3-glucan synthase ags1 [Aspergillus fumigatus]